jgi:hypothetical protein
LRKIILFAILVSLIQGVFAANFWEPLRAIPEIAVVINPIIIWLLFLVSLSILIISALAFNKKRSQQLFFVTIAFIFLFLKSSLNLVDFYFSPGYFMNFAVQGIFDFVVMLSLLLAIFRK